MDPKLAGRGDAIGRRTWTRLGGRSAEPLGLASMHVLPGWPFAHMADVTYKLRMRGKTGFDKFFDEQMRSPGFKKGYAKARAEVDAVDRIVRELDLARVELGVSKADLARLISAKPEIVRRLFTAKKSNPTLLTVVKLASALGFTVTLVPAKTRGKASRNRAA